MSWSTLVTMLSSSTRDQTSKESENVPLDNNFKSSSFLSNSNGELIIKKLTKFCQKENYTEPTAKIVSGTCKTLGELNKEQDCAK